MARAIRELEHARLPKILPNGCVTKHETQIGLTEVPQWPDWWFQAPRAADQGGVWRRSGHRLTRVLPWCPEVLARLTVADTRDKPDSVYYTIRVDGHVATLADNDLQQGRGWEIFPTVDLWSCVATTSQLHQIVQSLARHVPLIICEEAA